MATDILARGLALNLNRKVTWNNAATVFTGIKLNVTDTASDPNSLLMDLQIGGVSKAKIDKNGTATVSSVASGYVTTANVYINGSNSGALYFGTASDVVLARDAANTLAQRNGTNAQTFNFYNTYTDVSNYERVALTWASNVAYMKPQSAGTGAARLLIVQSGSTTVALLPAAATAGAGGRAFVTDATVTTFMTTVAGGGANKVPVVSDGTNWLIG